MTDQDVRDFLQRMVAEEPVPLLDPEPLALRARRRAARTVIVGAIGVAAAIAVLFAGVASIRSTSIPADDHTPTPAPSEELGIFAPVAGGIVYEDGDGIWGVDPAAPADPATRVQLTTEAGDPLGWSSDGTRLLIMQTIRDGQVVAEGPGSLRLSVLYADGSETQVAELQSGIPGATISPDGSRVVFATNKALYSVAVGGGRPLVLLETDDELEAATFSPDGDKIAYVVGGGDHGFRVWVMDADGSDAHQILANETTLGVGHVLGLAWSPAGDRIAFGNDVATYTFAPDGSGFTQVLSDGTQPFWSPDGSQLAYSSSCLAYEECSLAIADADGSHAQVFGFAQSGPWHPGQRRPTAPLPTDPTAPPEGSSADLGSFTSIGGWITYGNTSGIWAVDPAQSGDPDGQIQLSSERGEPLAWSRDGSKLLVRREVPGDSNQDGDLYALNADGTWDRLTQVNGYTSGASFYPDGTEIVYAAFQTSGNAIYVGDVEGGTPRLVTDDVAYPYEPTFSPDGSLIAYFDGRGDNSNSVRVMNADGSDVRELTGADYGHTDELVWSPDGSRLAFSLAGGGLFIVGLDGSGLTELIPHGENPAWSPDGSRISFQRRAGTPGQEVRNGEQVDVTYCPCGLGPLEIVTLDGGQIQEFGYAGSGPWNPLDPVGDTVPSPDPA